MFRIKTQRVPRKTPQVAPDKKPQGTLTTQLTTHDLKKKKRIELNAVANQPTKK